MGKMTIQELKACKGKRTLIVINAPDENIAAACEEAGIDIIVTGRRQPVDNTLAILPGIRAVAPNTLITAVMPIESCKISDEKAIADAVRLMEGGADLIYTTGALPDRIKKMARQYIPCVGHLGLVPYHCTWTGGYKAVGKTKEEAKRLFDLACQLDDAGVIAAEMECIPKQLASFISNKVSFLTYSMGSGSGCDAQYLFASDLLGLHKGHYPRHSITYDHFYEKSVDILKQFSNDVAEGIYPAQKHEINMDDQEFHAFLDTLK